jgi:hypothetical protein
MKNIFGVIMCFVPFPVFASELAEIPSLYIAPEIRSDFIAYPKIIDNGYVLIEKYYEAQKFFRPVPPDADFTKENILVFAWGGSGEDKIDYDQDEEGVYHFVLKKGLTKDYVSHIKIFVLKKTDRFLFHRVLE